MGRQDLRVEFATLFPAYSTWQS